MIKNFYLDNWSDLKLKTQEMHDEEVAKFREQHPTMSEISLKFESTNKDYSKNYSLLLTRIQLLEQVQTTLKTVSTADEISSIQDKTSTNLVLTDSNAANSFTSQSPSTFKTLTFVGTDLEERSYIKVSDKITLDDTTVNAMSDTTNHGAINYTAPTLEIKNVDIQSSAYNVFEGSLETNNTATHNKNITVSNVTVLKPTLTHNVINVYTPATNAKIVIKDSDFNINVLTTNVLRISNYTNADNVEIIFDNVKWTYENALNNVSESDWKYAGILLYQAAGADSALTNDLTHISTWSVKFRNCYYNGLKVNSINFGEHSQVAYAYKIGNNRTVSDLSSIMNVTFE